MVSVYRYNKKSFNDWVMCDVNIRNLRGLKEFSKSIYIFNFRVFFCYLECRKLERVLFFF